MDQLNEFDMKQLEISGRIIDEAYESTTEPAPVVEEKKPEEKKIVYMAAPSDEKVLSEAVKRMLAKSLLNEMDFANPYSLGLTATSNVVATPQTYEPSELEIKLTKMQKITDLINQNIYKIRDIENDKSSPVHIDIDPEGKMKALIQSTVSELVNLLFMTWNGTCAPQKQEEKKEEEEKKEPEEKKEEEEKKEPEESKENTEKTVGESVLSPSGDKFKIIEFKDNDAILYSEKEKKNYIIEKKILKKWSKI